MSLRHAAATQVRIGLAALAVLGWAAGVAAQTLPFRSYSSDEGLAQSVVLALGQERTGHLWVGTADGVSRFDGLEFVTFGLEDGLPHNVVRVIHQDARGTVWVGTDGGLVRWSDHGLEQPFPGSDGLWVRCIAETAEGVLWVGTYGHGVARIAGDRLELLTVHDGLPDDRVRAALVDRQQQLWLGTFGGGVARLRDGRFEIFAGEQGLGDLFVRDLLEDSRGTILAGTNGGVFRWDGAGFVPLEGAVELADEVVTSLLEDRRGRLWIGTRDRGACRLAGGGLTCFGAREGLADSSITDLLEDREGNLWFATFGGGISRLSSESFRNVTVENGLPHGSVQAFAEVDGQMWIATHGGGLARLAGGEVTVYGTAEGLPNEKVFALWNDGGGVLWVGTLDGAARFHDGRFTPFTVADGLAHPTVYHILRDSAGTLWFATLGGLTGVGADGSVRTYTTADGLPHERVNQVLEARTGGLWLATARGVVRFSGGRFTSYGEREGLANGFVNAIHERADGSLWIANAGGLDRLAGAVVRSYGERDGLVHAMCAALLEDDLGRLWIGTTRGIDVFDGASFEPFTLKDGLPSSEVLLGAAFKDSRGRLWFGTVRGATVFEPDAAPPRVPAPPVAITRIDALGEPIRLDAAPHLDHEQRSLRFEFVGISLTFPAEVVYEYRLEGFDERPRTTRARFVEYAALAPGEYRFAVRAGLGGEAWSSPATFAFHVAPAVWQTWWFRAIGLLGLVLIGYVGHLGRVQTLHRRERRLEELVRERTEEVHRERLEVKRKNEQLEVVNRIVRQINTELEFPDLLQSILERVGRFQSATCALALVRAGAAAPFQVQASLGWPGPMPLEVALTREEIDDGLLADARVLAPGIHLCPLDSSDPHHPTAALPRPSLVMSVELEGEPAGYLIYGLPRGSEIGPRDLEALADLRAHVTSAFVKGRILGELRQLNATKNEFLGIAAHDLRSPLGGILGTTGLLLRLLDEGRVDVARWRRFLASIHTTTDQLLQLVNDLLDVAAIESGLVEVRFERLRMSVLLGEREAIHLPAAQAKRIELEVDDAAAAAEVVGDRMRVSEVLDNLIGNAVKFTAAGGKVRVWCEPGPSELAVHVSDTGLGLEADELQRTFSGARLSARPTGGEPSTGLGLVIVKKLVEMQGGRVWVASTKGVGSTFSFSLPLAAPTPAPLV